MKAQSFAVFARLLQSGSGLVIGPDKTYLLETRLAPILKQQGLRDLDALAERVRPDRSGALERQVIEAMTTNESFFFRDDKPFAHFRSQALPRLHAARGAGARLRVWSAASSAGQEAYSLAMILSETSSALNGRAVEILGTDISVEQVERARAALYTQFEVQRGLPIQYLVKYFKKEDCNWRMTDKIRSQVTFREWNLLTDLQPLGRFDIVFCRNVLIYFDQPTKRRALEAIAGQMMPDGLLYLGGAETVLGVTDRFAPIAGEHGVYQPVSARPTAASARTAAHAPAFAQVAAAAV
jgi:chemotaxis protein methyltransferase CheR